MLNVVWYRVDSSDAVSFGSEQKCWEGLGIHVGQFNLERFQKSQQYDDIDEGNAMKMQMNQIKNYKS